MRCFKCGTNIADNIEKCPNCGQNFKNVKKDISKNLYAKIKELSNQNGDTDLPLGLTLGDVISEKYTIDSYKGEFLIFYSFIAIDNFNKQKVQIDFVKGGIIKNSSDESIFINSMREEKFRQHENLALIFDYGKHDQNHYIVTENLDGVSLNKIISIKKESNENFSLDEVEPIIAQITDALTDIHEDSLNGYLIPDNIIILSDVLKIRNHFWFRAFNGDTILKYFTSESPSYYYLAPELRGGSRKLTNATDLYSIGVLISSLLTGKLFKGVPYNLTEYGEELPDEIDPIFYKLIDKNSNKRYQNIDQFLFDFDAVFEEPIVFSGEKTKIVSSADVAMLDDIDNPYKFEDELETEMHKSRPDLKGDGNSDQFDPDEVETEVMDPPKNIETKLPPPKFKEKKKVAETKIEEPKKVEKEEIKEEENPFYQPEKFKQEQQDAFKNQNVAPPQQSPYDYAPPQQQPYQQMHPSMYQQIPPYQPNDNRMIWLIGIIIILIVALSTSVIVIFLIKNSGGDKIDPAILRRLQAEASINTTLKQQQELENKIAQLKKLQKELESSKNSVTSDGSDQAKIDKENKEKLEKIEKEQLALKRKQEKLTQERKKAEKDKLEADKKIREKKLEKELAKQREIRSKKIAKKRVVKKDKKKIERKIVKKEKKEKKEIIIKKTAKKDSKTTEKDLSAEADALLAMANKEVKGDNKKDNSVAIKKEDKKEDNLPKTGCPKGMIFIKDGSFNYGSSTSDPLRSAAEPVLRAVKLNGFCIDRFESGKGNTSYVSALNRCKRKGKRLCKVQEWEKACKGFMSKRFPYGNKFKADRCNTADGDGEERVWKPGGSFKRCRSPYGIYDMSGNLSEWTTSGSGSKQMLKGGSYKSEDYDAKCSSVELRSKTYRAKETGYRCCKDPE